MMAKKANEIEVTVAEVVDHLRITGQFSPALNDVVQRKVTAEAAKNSGIKVTTAQLQKAADVFRAVNDLSKASDTNKWLKSTGISVETFEGYLETNILISKFKDALEKKADKAKYLSKQGIEESLGEMIYQDWLKNQFK
jgi:hypothetical protein